MHVGRTRDRPCEVPRPDDEGHGLAGDHMKNYYLDPDVYAVLVEAVLHEAQRFYHDAHCRNGCGCDLDTVMPDVLPGETAVVRCSCNERWYDWGLRGRD